ncbi:hypothetical protein V5799_006123 [Amblyomma americanum]|uniref:Uncharacterized protein n=1 Tax=Amblyomma americanum TaxID=6943 RepID=A0AAQ4DXA7_AMBAM
MLVVTLCVATLVLGKLGPPGGPQKLHYHVADIFKVFESWPASVAISDSDNDTMFECLAAKRTEIDPVAKTATYLWVLPETDHSPRYSGHVSSSCSGTCWQEVRFYVRPGARPGTMDMTVNDDPTPREGVVYYLDEQCVIMDLEYHGHQCLLWTRPELKDSVPQVCIDHFVDTCGVVPPAHSRDLCPDGEGDY